MHQAAYQYVVRTLQRYPDRRRVLEIGSREINGGVRQLFPLATSYVGIDLEAGPGVDVVASGASYQPPTPVDCVICTEVLEHTAKGVQLIENAYRALAAGGVFIVTCATDPRAPHSGADGGVVRAMEWYRNVGETELRGWLEAAGFQEVEVESDRTVGDLYAHARK